MKLKIHFVIFVLLLGTAFHGLSALEFTDGRIKLVIDEKLGRFSLYYMTDVEKQIYEPLFWDKDKRTSYLAVSIDGKEYRLGDDKSFKMFVRGTDKKPVLAFESSMFSVTQEFSFIRTASSGVSNGVRIDMRLENWSSKLAIAGLRLLVDTFLGEKNNPNFRTDLQPIGSELVITKTTHDQYWLSRNNRYGVMGSIFVDGIDPPDFVMFANWKRLNNAKFMIEYIATRNFSALPFSTKDSAVCYYMEAIPMERWTQRTMTVLLAAEDQYGFDANKSKATPSYEYYRQQYTEAEPSKENNTQVVVVQSPPVQTPAPVVVQPPPVQTPAPAPVVVQLPPAQAPVPASKPPEKQEKTPLLYPVAPMRVDLMTLRELIYKVDEYIYSGASISEAELKAMEAAIFKLKARYGAVFNTY